MNGAKAVQQVPFVLQQCQLDVIWTDLMSSLGNLKPLYGALRSKPVEADLRRSLCACVIQVTSRPELIT